MTAVIAGLTLLTATYISFPRPLPPMKKAPQNPASRFKLSGWTAQLMIGGVLALAMAPAQAQWVTIVSEDFESHPVAATSLNDTQDADPASPIVVTDDDPLNSSAGAGVQVVNWESKSGDKALLVRSGSESILQILEPRTGSRYQLDFHIYSHMGDGDRNFYIITRGMGIDSNGDDFIAYRADRGTSTGIFYYEGIDWSTWLQVPGVERAEDQWQHHRFIIDTDTKTYDLYIDDMENPVLTEARLSRPAPSVPVAIIIRHEGNSANDGYFLIDDISLAVEGSRDLSEPFIEGFEEYAAMKSLDDDANPGAPWITNEVDGVGNGRPLNPIKVQVVDSSVTEPHSGSKCLKIEGGQQGGVSFAWGSTPQEDVEITWWAKVPASETGRQANYLRMSLYGVEGGRSDQGDIALVGYGSRDASVGDETSVTYYNNGWINSQVDYTPDTWEEYRLITHRAEGTYTVIKNPSSNPEIIADRKPFIGGAIEYGHMFMAAWSSSNNDNDGERTHHPPVYIDDIEIKAVVSETTEPVVPYTPVAEETDAFEKYSIVRLPGAVSGVAVDPRDSRTVIASTGIGAGAILRVIQNEEGVWQLDTNPLVSGLDRPSGVDVDSQGNIWWTHDYTQSLRRLKAPWGDMQPEVIISTFNDIAADDDPIDVVVTGANFNGELGKPGWIVVADRDVDAIGLRGLYIVDPATITPNQTAYAEFLVEPTSELGGSTLNALAYLDSTGEVLVANNDGTITAVNANGEIRLVRFPQSPFSRPVGLAVDPTTGRLWVADRTMAEIWSIDPTTDSDEGDRREVSFSLSDEVDPSYQIQINDPGLAFSADGRVVVIADGNQGNRGGWLTILERAVAVVTPEIGPITVTKAAFEGSNFVLTWEVSGATKFHVLRAPSLDADFVDISGELNTPSFTDTNPPAGQAFYKITAE